MENDMEGGGGGWVANFGKPHSPSTNAESQLPCDCECFCPCDSPGLNLATQSQSRHWFRVQRLGFRPKLQHALQPFAPPGTPNSNSGPPDCILTCFF